MTTRLHCPKCGEQFNHEDSSAGKTGGGIGGAIAGAMLGAKFGIVGGPLGAIAGTIPGAILGGLGLGKASNSSTTRGVPNAASASPCRLEMGRRHSRRPIACSSGQRELRARFLPAK